MAGPVKAPFLTNKVLRGIAHLVRIAKPKFDNPIASGLTDREADECQTAEQWLRRMERHRTSTAGARKGELDL